ncbi:MAG: nucleotidyltransferase substrate binding protein [Pseudomonadota bacterium]
MNKEIRWKQRFQNLQKAYFQLQKGLKIAKPGEIERQGIIKSFEFTFELAWKTLKDFLEDRGVEVSFPRDIIKEAFHHGIISDGEIWLDMLENRNLLAHTYDEKRAKEAMRLIVSAYQPAMAKLIAFFNKENK